MNLIGSYWNLPSLRVRVSLLKVAAFPTSCGSFIEMAKAGLPHRLEFVDYLVQPAMKSHRTELKALSYP